MTIALPHLSYLETRGPRGTLKLFALEDRDSFVQRIELDRGALPSRDSLFSGKWFRIKEVHITTAGNLAGRAPSVCSGRGRQRFPWPDDELDRQE